jgi:hypothetical protein
MHCARHLFSTEIIAFSAVLFAGTRIISKSGFSTVSLGVIHVLIRGDLPNGAAIITMGVGLRAMSKGVGLPPNPKAMKAAH